MNEKQRQFKKDLAQLEALLWGARPRKEQDNVKIMGLLCHAILRFTPYFQGDDAERQALRKRCGENAKRYVDVLYKASQVLKPEEEYQAFLKYQ